MSQQGKPITEQAKDAIAAAGGKAKETYDAATQKISEVRVQLSRALPFAY
jgi:hypothetical protein